MLDKNQIEAASRTLRDHWRAGTKLAALETSQRPRDRKEAYAIQAALENHSVGNLFGWKIAATSAAGQKHINVDDPMAGRILSETVLPDGGTASMAGNEMQVAEPEFAFRMATDLPPRSSPYSVQQTLDAVATLHPAIEIPIRGSRISSARVLRKSSRTMPARICSFLARPPLRTGVRSTWSRRNRSLRCAAGNSPVMARMCLATPKSR